MAEAAALSASAVLALDRVQELPSAAASWAVPVPEVLVVHEPLERPSDVANRFFQLDWSSKVASYSLADSAV